MQADEHEIRQLVATWMEATKAGDAETVLSLMADDVVFLVAFSLIRVSRKWRLELASDAAIE